MRCRRSSPRRAAACWTTHGRATARSRATLAAASRCSRSSTRTAPIRRAARSPSRRSPRFATGLATQPVAARAQLVSLSFDPEYDTPDVMRMFSKTYGAAERKPAWHFLTTASNADLAPLLEGFGQDAARRGHEGRTASWTTRCASSSSTARSRVREIYSSAYLMPEVIVNDILTLAAEGTTR